MHISISKDKQNSILCCTNLGYSIVNVQVTIEVKYDSLKSIFRHAVCAVFSFRDCRIRLQRK